MCGITGWISYQRDLTQERQTVSAMTDTMACRGPDDSGVWLTPHVAFGHRRLSIIDLPGGHQPITHQVRTGHDSTAPVTLVYSGETYNFVELREELRSRGHHFETDSDSEVVLAGFIEWGAGVAEKLNGMYAFAVHDGRDASVTLVRDRLGIKPLYYDTTDDGVLFASEPKAILANPLASRTVGTEGLRELFAFVKTPGAAVWDDMHEVEPGTTVRFDRSGSRVSTYWRLESHEHPDDLEDTIAHVRELLDDIGARQLIADVPRCVLLSGGLDSSALTALAGQQLARQGERPRSFAVDFSGGFTADSLRGTPDGPYVADVAGHVGTQHQDIVLDPETLSDPEVRRACVAARDMPIGLGDMDQSLLLLFRAIRAQSTVALSGESADEVFGGYAWFHQQEVRDAETFPWLSTVANRRQSAGVDPFAGSAVFQELDLPAFRADSYATALAQLPTLPGEEGTEATMRRLSWLHLTRFVRVLLDRKDRMSMATSLEVRVPFCDHRLVEYVFNAPWAMKNFDGREKSLLRAATADVLPKSVLERVKSPYPSTQDTGYVAALQRQALEVIDRRPASLALFDDEWLRGVRTADPTALASGDRQGLERVLDFDVWEQQRQPQLELPGLSASGQRG